MAKSIAVHHGAMPRHIGSSIVDYFNQGKINYLFCTSTLIEGVNTAAKNVILFDKKKGPKPIDYFDFKNIVGRSGRMKQHFIGRIFQFHPEPLSKEIQVDIPFYTQKDARSELLIQLDSNDVKNKNSEVYKKIESLEPDLRNLVRKNKGIPIEGQLNIIKRLTENIDYYHPLLCWNKTPAYEQLECVIDLAWNNLLKKDEKKGGVLTSKQLTYMTQRYIKLGSTSEFIKSLVNNQYHSEEQVDESIRTQKAIDTALQVIQHWFDYKLPKLLITISEIQSYVFSKNGRPQGDYTYIASQIENSFLPNNLAILLEYGIPVTAIRKLQKYIAPKTPADEVITVIKKINLDDAGLIEYEVNKVKNIF